jgi:hypothetical protein
MLDEARDMLVRAFMKNDVDTVSVAVMAIEKELAKMRLMLPRRKRRRF